MSEDSDKTRQEEEDATMRDLETQFYGEEGALDMPEKSEEIGDVHSAVRTAVERAPDASNSAEDLIDELQEGEILPESIHTPRLVAFLESLGNRFGVRINVDGRSLYPKNTGFEMDFSVSFLETFLRRGATVSALMAPILLASNAMAAHLPAAGLPQEAVEYVNDGGDIMYNWPAILAVVGILGILGYAKRKDIKKFKKYLVKKFIKTEKDKEIKGLFDDYEEAKRNRSDEEAERAKEKLIAATMGELPDDMDEAIENVGEIEEDEIKEAM